MAHEINTTSRKDLYKGPFYTEGDAFQVNIRYKRTDELVASRGFVPDPLYPHFVCLDFRGITVQTALTVEDADYIISNMINDWLRNGGGIKQQEEELDADREGA
jgi:hypothetical protein